MAKSDQVPVDSPFHRLSTGDEVLADLNLEGKVAIVTGGYSGIGLETTRSLAKKGVKVIVPVRNQEKAAETMADIEGDVHTSQLDLSDLKSVHAFSEKMLSEIDHLDYLINNAGIMANPETRVGPGWESQFAVNHIGHFALAHGLRSLIRKSEGIRVVAVSSAAHKMSGIHFDDIHFETRPYDKWQAYGQSKTANTMFANALARRLKDIGGHAFSLHPGGIMTPLQRHLQQEEMVAMGWMNEDGTLTELAKSGFKTPEQGCSTTLWCATSELLEGKAGVYCEDCNISAPTDPDHPHARFVGADPQSYDDEAAERLWKESAEMLDSVGAL